MGLVNHTIRNLINGVSQQAPSIRLDNQVDEQENMIPDLTLGLIRRNPVSLEDVAVHDASRDYTGEDAMFKYTLNEQPVTIGIKSDGTVYRFDPSGSTTEIVQDDKVKEYLSYTDKNNIVMLETSEQVLLLNREVEASTDLTDYVEAYAYEREPTDDSGDYVARTEAFYVYGENEYETSTTRFIADKLFIKNDNGKWVIYTPKVGYFNSSVNGADYAYGVFQNYTGVITELEAGTYESAEAGKEYLNVKVDLVNTFNPSDTAVLPEMYDYTDFNISIAKGVGSGTAQITLAFNGIDRYTEDLPAEYGVWNDTFGDLLTGIDGNLTMTYEGITCTAQTYHAGAIKKWSITTVIDQRRQVSFLPLSLKFNYIESKDYDYDNSNYWVVKPESSSVTSLKKFEYGSAVGSTKIITEDFSTFVRITYVSSTVAVNESVDVLGATLDDIDIPNLDTTDASGRPARLIVGSCVYEESSTVRHYNVLTQKSSGISVTTVDSYFYDGVDTDFGSEVVDTVDEGKEVEYLYGASNVFRKTTLHDAVPTIFGTVYFYDYLAKASTTTYPRILTWVDNASDGVVYTLELFTVSYVGVVSPVTDMSVSVTGSAASTPKTINDALTAAMAAKAAYSSWFSGYSSKSNTTVWDLIYPTAVMKLTTDIGSDMGYSITESNLSNTAAIEDASLLPSTIDTGSTPFIVRVNPDVSSDTTNYYLEYLDSSNAWVETAIANLDYLDDYTMPMGIVKDSSSKITIDKNNWVYPASGDAVSNAVPSIVGKTIQDIILFNSRLGFASHDTLVFSQIDDYFNLYRTTTSKSLISDRVDLKLDSSRLGYKKIENIFNMGGKIFINTGDTQSILTLPTDLDLSKSAFNQVSSHHLNSGKPIPMRQTMIFPLLAGSFTNIIDFTPDSIGGYSAVNLNRHCEKYIKGEVVQMIYTSNMILLRTDDDPKVVYVNNSFIKDNTLAQNAWHKWTFEYDVKFIYAEGTLIKFTFEDVTGGNTLFGDLELVPDSVIEDTDTQIGYKPYLDFLTSNETLSGNITGALRISSVSGAEETVHSSDSLYGITYDSSVKLSEIVARTQNQDGTEKMGFVTLMLRRMVLNMGYTGRLAITIARTARDSYVHNYVPKVIGDIIIGREEVSDESARFPINGKAEDIGITIGTVNNFVPFSILSIEWQGQLIKRGGRL